MDDYHILQSLRAMAWERAKGELRSIGLTYYSDVDAFKEINDAIDAFILNVEDNALGGFT